MLSATQRATLSKRQLGGAGETPSPRRQPFNRSSITRNAPPSGVKTAPKQVTVGSRSTAKLHHDNFQAAAQSYSPGRAAKRRTGKTTLQERDGIHVMSQEELLDSIEFGRRIGSGNWATVFEARARRGGAMKAVKIAQRESHDAYRSEQRYQALETEFQTLRTIPLSECWHPNIIHYDALIQTPTTTCLVMPLADQPMTVCIPLSTCQRYFLQLADAVNWLHDHCITHNDIKLANIVIKNPDHAAAGDTVLVDFGFARTHHPGGPSDFLSTEMWGTPEYLACERAIGETHDERLSDIWSLGVSFFEMATGRTPFEKQEESFVTEEARAEYLRRTQAAEWHIDSDVPADLEDLCRQMVHNKPRRRLALKDVPYHEFFRRNSIQDSSMEGDRLGLGDFDDTFESTSTSPARHTQRSGQLILPEHLKAADPDNSGIPFPLSPSPALNLEDTSLVTDLVHGPAPWVEEMGLQSHRPSIAPADSPARRTLGFRGGHSPGTSITQRSPLRTALHNATSRANLPSHSPRKWPAGQLSSKHEVSEVLTHTSILSSKRTRHTTLLSQHSLRTPGRTPGSTRRLRDEMEGSPTKSRIPQPSRLLRQGSSGLPLHSPAQETQAAMPQHNLSEPEAVPPLPTAVRTDRNSSRRRSISEPSSLDSIAPPRYGSLVDTDVADTTFEDHGEAPASRRSLVSQCASEGDSDLEPDAPPAAHELIAAEQEISHSGIISPVPFLNVIECESTGAGSHGPHSLSPIPERLSPEECSGPVQKPSGSPSRRRNLSPVSAQSGRTGSHVALLNRLQELEDTAVKLHGLVKQCRLDLVLAGYSDDLATVNSVHQSISAPEQVIEALDRVLLGADLEVGIARPETALTEGRFEDAPMELDDDGNVTQRLGQPLPPPPPHQEGEVETTGMAAQGEAESVKMAAVSHSTEALATKRVSNVGPTGELEIIEELRDYDVITWSPEASAHVAAASTLEKTPSKRRKGLQNYRAPTTKSERSPVDDASDKVSQTSGSLLKRSFSHLKGRRTPSIDLLKGKRTNAEAASIVSETPSEPTEPPASQHRRSKSATLSLFNFNVSVTPRGEGALSPPTAATFPRNGKSAARGGNGGQTATGPVMAPPSLLAGLRGPRQPFFGSSNRHNAAQPSVDSIIKGAAKIPLRAAGVVSPAASMHTNSTTSTPSGPLWRRIKGAARGQVAALM